jgi:hypothetical protein
LCQEVIQLQLDGAGALEGRIAQFGKTRDLCRQLTSDFVRQFESDFTHNECQVTKESDLTHNVCCKTRDLCRKLTNEFFAAIGIGLDS